MKILLLCVLLIFSAPSSAGWFTGMLKIGTGVGIGIGISKGLETREEKIRRERAEKANRELWEMHVLSSYNEDTYKELRRYIEDSVYITDINNADTVAWSYFDNKEYDEAIKIYKSKVLPWINDFSIKQKEHYKNNFINMKTVKSCFFIGCNELVNKAIKESMGEKEKMKILSRVKRKALDFEKRITTKIKE